MTDENPNKPANGASRKRRFIAGAVGGCLGALVAMHVSSVLLTRGASEDAMTAVVHAAQVVESSRHMICVTPDDIRERNANTALAETHLKRAQELVLHPGGDILVVSRLSNLTLSQVESSSAISIALQNRCWLPKLP